MSGPKCYEYESSFEPVYQSYTDSVVPPAPRQENVEVRLQRIACRLKEGVPPLFRMHLEHMLRTPAAQRDSLHDWQSTADEEVFLRRVELSEQAKEKLRASGVVQLDMVRQQFDVRYDLRNHEMYVDAQTVLTERVRSEIAAERRHTLMDAVGETLQLEMLRVCHNFEGEFVEQAMLRAFKSRNFTVACTNSSPTQRVYHVGRPA